MKPFQQFLTLLRFHATASPWIWIFPVAFGLQPCIMIMVGQNWRDLTISLSSAPMLWMTPVLLAVFIFTPELLAGMRSTTPQTQQQVQSFSAEFLLTRPVDRPVLFHARMALFWVLVLLPILLLLALALWRPAVNIEVPLKPPGSGEIYLKNLPGATVTKTTKSTEVITSSVGRLAIAGSLSLLAVGLAAFWQSFVFFILRLRYARVIFWTAFIVGVAGMPWLMIGRQNRHHWLEGLIFWVLNNCAAAVGVTALIVGFSWVFSSARSKTIEYP